MTMFRRKANSEVEGEVCPYCEFVNSAGAITCDQCYYELNKAPRDQGEPVSTEMSNSIFDELMSDEDDSWEDGEALDVVLTLDQDPLEVDQYEVTDFTAEEPESIGFMESSSPELHETVSHEPVEVTVEDVGEAPKKIVPPIDFGNTDPLSEVPEPVHQGRGTVFSPSSPSKMDDDLLGHVGGSELPSLPSDDLYENKIDLAAKKAPAPTPAVVLPPTPVIVIPETPMIEKGIWPWPASEPWDARQVHREVVSALEQVKAGRNEEATATIDALGPHLSEENVDLIYHVGMVLKQLGRIDEVKGMLERAQSEMPGNEHVSSAVAHLGV